jgi:hypothetical protein
MHSVATSPSAATAQYAVPRRFGMAGILAITTLMAVLFGLLRSTGAPPAIYVFVGVLALVTCLVQMWYGDVPRIASIVAGAICLPVCILGTSFVRFFMDFDDRMSVDEISWVICTLPVTTVFGAGFGYLAGACTAGLFLLMDLIEPHLPGGSSGSLRYARPARKRDDIVMATLVPSDEGLSDQVIQALLSDNPYVPRPIEPGERPTETRPVESNEFDDV